MSERLLRVDDAFTASGPGVIVMPRFTVTEARRGRFPVRLVLPDGSERAATASIDVAHMRGAAGQFAMYRLFDVDLADVVKGTEIWSAE